MTDVETPAKPGTSYKGYSAPLVLLGGLVGFPLVLMLFFNRWDAPTDADYVQMAFISVACATVAIVTVLGLLVDRILRKASVSTIGILAVIALVVTLTQLQSLGYASDLLLQRLSLSN
jgi:hypothetical protein